MIAFNARLLLTIDQAKDSKLGIIPWASPVSYFGLIGSSEIATVGLNPSNREFVDSSGVELSGRLRRFHTLNSLKLRSWRELSVPQLRALQSTYDDYFQNNPYDGWFKRLDEILSGCGISYYDSESPGCHLDIVPFATFEKWGRLPKSQQQALRQLSGSTLGCIVRQSSLAVLLLNGSSVVREFEACTRIQFDELRIGGASLPRSSGRNVVGIGFRGVCDEIMGTWLARRVLVIGWNHNIQSSFGVTRSAIESITAWVHKQVAEWYESKKPEAGR